MNTASITSMVNAANPKIVSSQFDNQEPTNQSHTLDCEDSCSEVALVDGRREEKHEEEILEHVHHNQNATQRALKISKASVLSRKNFLLLCLFLTIGSIAVGTIVIVRNASGSNSHFCKDAREGDVLVQCRCFNEMVNQDVVTAEARDRFANLSRVLNLHPSNIYSCNPANLALWWLSDSLKTSDQRVELSSTGLLSKESIERLTERYALASFFLSLRGYWWIQNGGWMTNSSVCSWNGVECSQKGGRIVGLILEAKNLSGTVPKEVTLLNGIKDINLASNNIGGDLPREMLAKLRYLRGLNLAHNHITGHIPDPVNMTRLFQLLISEALDHQIFQFFLDYMPRAVEDSSLSNISFDDVLKLWKQMIQNDTSAAHFPVEVVMKAANHDLYSIDISDNLFTGIIPYGYALLNRLRILKIKNNRLDGHMFLEPISDLSAKLGTLDLSGNFLTGRLPRTVGYLTNLEHVSINGNLMSGRIPTEVGLLDKLVSLDVGGNAFTGTVPSELGLAAQMEFLNFSNTDLTGSIPVELCEELVYLDYVLVDCPLLENCSCCCCRPKVPGSIEELSCSFN